MFDLLKNLGNIGPLLQQAKEMEQKMTAMRQEMSRRHFTADAGAGMVEATVNGMMEMVKVKIDKSKIDPSDTEMLEDLIASAVRAAQIKARTTMGEEMQRMAGDLPIPPGLLQ